MGEAADVMRRKMAAFNAQDAKGLQEIFTADCQVEVPGASLRGPEHVVAFFSVFWEAFPDLHCEITQVVEEASVVAIQAMTTGTHLATLHTPGGDIPLTGKRVDLPIADVYEVEGGLITASHLYFDRLALLERLGVAAAPVAA